MQDITMSDQVNSSFSSIVSAGTRFHSYRTAESLHARGVLTRLITGRKASPSPAIPKHLVRYIPTPEYIGLLANRMPFIGSRIPYNAFTDNLFDVLASRYVEKTDVFVGFGNYSLLQMQKYHKQGSLLVLDQRIAHINTELAMHHQEAKQFGMPFPPAHLNKWIRSKARNEYKMADLILAPSDFVYNSLIQNGISASKISMAPFGVNSNLFRPTSRKSMAQNDLSVLFVGALSARKGLHYLLQALEILKCSGLRLELRTVGLIQDYMLPFLKQFRGIWRHLGTLPQKQLAQIYNTADIFCLPTLCEGNALVVGEAAASGLPIVTTTSAGAPFKHTSECLRVPPRDATALAAAIMQLALDPALRVRLAENAAIKARSLTWQAYGESVFVAIQTALRNRSSHSLEVRQ